MKKILYLLIFGFSLSVSLSAQETSDHFSRKNAIKFSPFSLGFAEFQVGYERYFKERSSSFVLMPSVFLKDGKDESNTGFQLMGQYRYYLSHKRSDVSNLILGLHNVGFYTGVYAQYLDYQEDYTVDIYVQGDYQPQRLELHKDVTSVEGGVLIGFQMDITKRILFDFYVGGGVRNSNVDDDGEDIEGQLDYYSDYNVLDLEYKGVKPKVGLQLGITF